MRYPVIIADNTGTESVQARPLEGSGAPTTSSTGTGCTSTQFKCQEQVNFVQAAEARPIEGSVAPTTLSTCVPIGSFANGINECEDKSDEFGK